MKYLKTFESYEDNLFQFVEYLKTLNYTPITIRELMDHYSDEIKVMTDEGFNYDQILTKLKQNLPKTSDNKYLKHIMPKGTWRLNTYL